jgi:RNA polymerase sigma-70 factor (ECF subfamily)
MSDKDLIAQILSGDVSPFRHIVDKYKLQVQRTCYGFTQSQSDAEDIAQEVFIEVYESLGSFRHESQFSTWIYRIAVNKSLNHIRKQKRRSIMQSLEDMLMGKNKNGSGDYADDARLPDDFTDPDENINRLKIALNDLPSNQRTALTLYTYQQLSYKQISDIMNVSLSSVESLIFRSKKNLRKIMVENAISE